ncbi:hypothetical protein MRX96_008991 [Rhipicephalus microplus]
MLSAATAGRAAAQLAQVHALFMHGGYWRCTCVGCCCRSVAEVATPCGGEGTSVIAARASSPLPLCVLHCGEEGERTKTAAGARDGHRSTSRPNFRLRLAGISLQELLQAVVMGGTVRPSVIRESWTVSLAFFRSLQEH